jgi:NCAIR mutase (PurE)-related protein
MNIRTLLEKYSSGELSIDEVQRQISIDSIKLVGNNFAQLDIDREIRKEVPEVVFAKGKEYKDILRIVLASLSRNKQVVVSKIQVGHIHKLCNILRKKNLGIEIGKKSTTILVTDSSSSKRISRVGGGKIGILAAGTSDIGIAEEARLVAKAMGCETILSYDVGIAGIHRVFPAVEEMMSDKVSAIVVVAGMEGALASVVSSMVNIPVIGVPTSVGYGFGSDGVAALASMLQTCTFGLAVVNIDNGIGGGAFAALIATQRVRSILNDPAGNKYTIGPKETESDAGYGKRRNKNC